MGESLPPLAVEACTGHSHPLLLQVDGLHGWYVCPAAAGGCGDFFNLAQINITRHVPKDVARMAHWFAAAVQGTDGEALLAHLRGESAA